MPRLLPLTLLLGAALLLSASAPSPPRCRVEAIYTPSFGSEYGSLMVRLLPHCSPGGYAHVRLGNYGGPGSKATGPTETISNERVELLWQTQPRYRSVLWEAESGKQYSIPIQRR